MTQTFDADGFTARLKRLKEEREKRDGSRSNHLIALDVSAIMRREPPLNPTAVWRWFEKDAVPDLETIWAIARYYGVNPGWLAFGEEAASRYANVHSGGDSEASGKGAEGKRHGPPPLAMAPKRKRGTADGS